MAFSITLPSQGQEDQGSSRDLSHAATAAPAFGLAGQQRTASGAGGRC